MSFPLVASLLLLNSPTALQSSQATHSIADQTGIQWTFPYAAAKEKAIRENRILFVKPIAFGTTRDGGW